MIDIINTIKYDRLKKVKLGKLKDSWSHDLRPKAIKKILYVLRTITLLNFFQKLKQNKLKNSIAKEGYNPEKYSYVLIMQDGPNTDTPYRVKDGNSRVKILKELYGKDYEIGVMESMGETNNSNDTNNTIIQKILLGTSSLPIILIPSMIFFLWYMFIEVIIVSLTCYFIMALTKDISYKANSENHPKKYLSLVYDYALPIYKGLMTIYYNYRMILLALVLGVYTYHVVTTHIIGLLVIVGVTIVLRVIAEKVFEDVNITIPTLLEKVKK